MRTENEILKMSDKASDECNQPTRNRSGMSYEEGVRVALDWVINDDSDEFEPFE